MTQERNSKVGIASAFVLAPLLLIASLLAMGGPKAPASRFHNAPLSADQQKNPYAGKAAAAKAGAGLYYLSCSSCHGNDARGVGDARTLRSGATQSAPDGELFWFITTGEPEKGMPPFTYLSEQQRWQIVTYVKSLSDSKLKRRNLTGVPTRSSQARGK